jgi:hypothetical protein
MWIPFFLFGSLPFWIVLVLFNLLLIGLVETEKPGWATTATVLLVGMFWFFGDPAFGAAITANPLNIGLYLLAYVGIGLVWSFVKWYFYVQECRDQYLADREQFLQDRRITLNELILDDALKAEFKRWLPSSRYEIQPKASNNKGRITLWATYWPWSFLWSFVDDIVKNTFNWLFVRFQGLFQAISNRIWGDAKELL